MSARTSYYIHMGNILCMILAILLPMIFSLPAELHDLQRHWSGLAPALEEQQHVSDDAVKSREGRSADPIDDELTVSKLTPQEILQVLVARYNSKIHHEPRARMVLDGFTDKDITEICGTSASLKCGREVMMSFGEENGGGIDARCNIRKSFLDCIDESRRECKEMAKSGVYPLLPPQSEIAKFQGKVWRALWTSGGCLLAN